MHTKLAKAFLVASLIFGALPSLAQEAPLVQDPADRLLRERQEQDRLERLQQEAPAIALPQQPAFDPKAAPQSIRESGATFAIEHIVMKGDALLEQAEIETITQAFDGMQLGVNRINLLLHKLTQAYVERGYVTTRVYVGEQNLSAGILEVTVIPGKVEKLLMNGKPLALGDDLAMPVEEGAVLRLQALEQGMDQINRLRRNRAQLQIQPGQTPGGSIVAITNTPGDRLYYNVGVDNGGDKATGEQRLRAGVEANNLLGLQESVNLTYNGSLDTNALLLGATLPLGYNTFSYTYSYSEFQNLVGDVALVFGRSQGHTLAWNRLLARSRFGKSAFDVSLSVRAAEREINNIALTPQSLSVLRLGYSNLRRFQLGDKAGFWTVDLSYSRGLDVLDATNDSDVADLPTEAAHAQFDKVNLATNVSLALNERWTYRGSFDAQWADEGLFGSEQFFAGGAASVRGFAESAIAGERGLGMRHELSYAGWPVLNNKLRLAPFVFLDAARAQLVAESEWHDLAGAGVGVRASGKHFSAELILGQPLQAPEPIDDDARVHASINFNF
jgi:hemolysin activation/secretion protein